MNGVTRIFANVGQALFAIERRDNHTIVYDCGGENKHDVAFAVPSALNLNEKIDILFISHYDSDHINGIEYLLRHCRVRHVVLPMVPEPFRWLQAQTMQDESFEKLFVENPSEAIESLVRELQDEGIDHRAPYIHYVVPWENEDNGGEPVAVDEARNNIIPAGSPIKLDDTDWIYLPFNRRLMTRDEWHVFLQLLGLDEYHSPDDILRHWRHYWYSDAYTKRTIKQAWSEATRIPAGAINDYCMTLYSGPSRFVGNKACLFTGDYNAKKYMEDLQSFYRRVWDNVEVVQIPHHGSWNNFSLNLIVPNGTHVISNKERPTKRGDVNASFVKEIIQTRGTMIETWKRQNNVI